MFHRFISVGLAAILGLAVTATIADAHHRNRDLKRSQCKGIIDCIFKSKSKTKSSSISRQTVSWRDAKKYRPGTIVVQTRQRALYYVISGDKAIRYPIGVGRQGFTWSGNDRISRKKEWPGWTPPREMVQREARKGRIMPSFIPGGPNNPLGARALYIGSSLYRIHGTNDPTTIGRAMSSGCIRMINEHVVDLYNRVSIGAKVHVYQ